MTLNYRLTSQKLSSITVRPETPDMDLEQQVKDLVMDAHGKLGVAPEGIFTPEVLSDETISKIAMLEDLVERMHGLLADICYADSTPGEKEIEKMLDEVANKLGLEDE